MTAQPLHLVIHTADLSRTQTLVPPPYPRSPTFKALWLPLQPAPPFLHAFSSVLPTPFLYLNLNSPTTVLRTFEKRLNHRSCPFCITVAQPPSHGAPPRSSSEALTLGPRRVILDLPLLWFVGTGSSYLFFTFQAFVAPTHFSFFDIIASLFCIVELTGVSCRARFAAKPSNTNPRARPRILTHSSTMGDRAQRQPSWLRDSTKNVLWILVWAMRGSPLELAR